MITPRQSRAARGLLGWTQQELSDRSGVAINALKRFEADSPIVTRGRTIDALENALVEGGVLFLPAAEGRGEGVCVADEAAAG